MAPTSVGKIAIRATAAMSALSSTEWHGPTWSTRYGSLPADQSLQTTGTCDSLSFGTTTPEAAEWHKVKLCEVTSFVPPPEFSGDTSGLKDEDQVCADLLHNIKQDRYTCFPRDQLDDLFDHLASKGYDLDFESVKNVTEIVGESEIQYTVIVDNKEFENLSFWEVLKYDPSRRFGFGALSVVVVGMFVFFVYCAVDHACSQYRAKQYWKRRDAEDAARRAAYDGEQGSFELTSSISQQLGDNENQPNRS